MKKSKPSSLVPFEPLGESPSLLWSPEVGQSPSGEKDSISLSLNELPEPESTGPILDITDGHGQLHFSGPLYVLATMLLPGDERRRNQLIARTKAQVCETIKKEIKAKTVRIPAPFLADLLTYLDSWLIKDWLAPEGGITALAEMSPIANLGNFFKTSRILESLASGAILSLVVSLAQAGEEASISKAIFHMRNLRSDGWLSAAWARYKPVAHFWSASCLFFPDDFPLNMRNILLPFKPERLSNFLAVAEIFRRRGLTIFPHGQKEPILNPATTWQLPADLSLPDASVTWSSVQEVKADLKNYAAPRRSY